MSTVTFAEVSLKFLEELSPSEKADYGDDREADMSPAAEFSDATSHGIVWGALTTEGNLLRAAILAAAGGNKLQQDALPPAVKKWDKLARKWANYVTEKAQDQSPLSAQIHVIDVSGFAYNKVTREAKAAPDKVTGFEMNPVAGVPSQATVKSDSMGPDCTYVTICHKDLNMLDAITWNGDQIVLPPTTGSFVIHHTTTSRESRINLSSAEKWYGYRFALNKTGRGPNSEKSSVVPQ